MGTYVNHLPGGLTHSSFALGHNSSYMEGVLRGFAVSEKTEEDLRHALGNARAETEALKSMLSKAADRLEDVVEAECSDESQGKALATAKRLRTVLERAEEKSNGQGGATLPPV